MPDSIAGAWELLGNRWGSFSWLTAFLIFSAYFIIDFLYVRYTLMVVGLFATRAANIGALMYFLMAFGVLNYVDNFLYTVPVAAGSWCGTYYTVHRELKKKGAKTSERSTLRL